MNTAQIEYLKQVVSNTKQAYDILGKVLNDSKYLIYKLEENIITPVKTTLKPAVKDYFSDAEFFNDIEKLDPDVLSKLNIVRENWGAPLVISPLYGAVFRYDNTDSLHNIKKWGKSRAVDFFPQSKKHKGGINDKSEMIEFVKILRLAGFKGIGIYPHFSPSWGVHADNRSIAYEWVDTAKYPEHNYVNVKVENM